MNTSDNTTNLDGIAIIGLAGRFPGARDVDQLWRNLRDGVESVSFFTAEELLAAGVPRRLVDDPDFVRAKAVIEEADAFDAEFFGYLPSEVEMMDPQQRVFLECAWSALEDAGCDPARYPGLIGVFGGMSQTTFLPLVKRLDPEGIKYSGYPLRLGTDKDYLTTRVSYKLDLRGPSLNVQTACSTSLVAVCQACHQLLGYQCDIALAGGVAISVPLKNGQLHREGSIHSSDGHCRPFEAQSQGIVEGDGVGIVVLKRLSDALADGDSIRAVIKGFAVNNDGSAKVGFTAPSPDGQANVIEAALALAGFAPDTISYIEAHGTGTQLGDPIEIAGLTKAFRARGATRNAFCAIGSVKSNFGHLDTAAGVTGLIKTVLALQHQQKPPSLHFKQANPKIEFASTPFFVNDRLCDWAATDNVPRRAGVSSFGLGGTNAHVVLEEAPAPPAPLPVRPWHLLVLSARTPAALDVAAANLASDLGQHSDEQLADVAYTLQTGRHPFLERRIVAARNPAEAATLLSSADARRVFSGRGAAEPPPVVFLFPGQGAQHVNMGRELYTHEPVFRHEVDRCAGLLEPHLDLDLRAVLYPPDTRVEVARLELMQTRLTQPAMFVIEYALARLWMSWGIVPQAMLGHSVGEYVAACLAEVLTLGDALHLLAVRAKLMQDQPAGSMLAIRLAEKEVLPLLGSRLSLAAVNSPNSCVVSGPIEAIAELERVLQQRGIAGRTLATSHAFHSAMMEPLAVPFTTEVNRVPRRSPRIPYLSNVTARWITDTDVADPGYWYQHLRHAVRFADGIAELAKDPHRVLLEVGPGQTLTTLARQHPARSDAQLVLPSLATDSGQPSEIGALYSAAGRVWITGVPLNWMGMQAGEPRRRVRLPTYPFERKRYWPSPAEVAAVPAPAAVPEVTASGPRLETAASIPVSSLSNVLSPMSNPTDRKNRILQEMSRVLHELSGMDTAQLDPTKSFLELGFDSLFLGQASQAFQKTFGVKLRFRDFFEAAPTPGDMAALLDQKMPQDKFAASVNAPAAPALEATSMPPIPSAVMPPLAPLLPAPMPTATVKLEVGASASAIERIVAQQLQAVLEVTRQQLAALGRGGELPAAAVAAPLPAPALPVTPVPPERSTAPIKIFGGSGTLSYLKTPPVAWQPLEHGPNNVLTNRQEEHLRAIIRDYTRKTAKSQRINQDIRAQVADPRTIVGFAPLWKDTVYQIVAARSAGSKLWDADGNEFVDVTLGFGAAIFGHSPDFIVKAIKEQVELGMELGAQSPLAGEVAKLFCEITGHERVCFCTAGTEAVMGALRLARAYTGRDRFATFVGDIHGRLDETCGRPLVVNNERTTVPGAPGIAPHLVKPAMFLEFGDPASLEAIARHANELAAVLVEPIRTRSPDLQPVQFLHDLRALTARTGITFICDEVVTGFRVAQGGAQAHFGLKPDLSTWGKGVAAGMPMGMISGKAEFMDALDGGMWSYGDDSVPEAAMTNFGGAGTFAKHPYTMAATLATLRHMKARGPRLQEELNERTARFVTTLNSYYREQRIPIHLERFSSFWSPRVLGDRKFEPLLFVCLRLLGVHIYVDYPCFLSTAHSDSDIAFLIDAFKQAGRMMQEGGFLPAPPAILVGSGTDGSNGTGGHASHSTELADSTVVKPSDLGQPAGQKLALTPGQLEIWLAARLGQDSAAAFNLSMSVDLHGPLQIDALCAAVQQVVARHEALRLVISPDGDHQRFLTELRLAVPLHDLSGVEEDGKSEAFSSFLVRETALPFDLSSGPLLRTTLVRFSPEHHRLVLTWFHIVSDGWSAGIIVKDLSAFYSAAVEKTIPGLPQPMPYRAYLEWRAAPQQIEDEANSEAFWLKQYADSVPVLDLPTDRPRPRLKTYNAGQESIQLDPDIMSGLTGVASRRGCTKFAVLLGAFSVLLHRLSGQDDLVLGLAAAGQSAVGNANLVGHCVNLLPYRSRISGSTPFVDYLAAVKSNLMDTYDHQSCTYGSLIRKLNLPRDASRLPLVSAIITHETDTAGIHFAGLETQLIGNARAYCNFDLELYLTESKCGTTATLCFNSDLFTSETIKRWLGHLESLLQAIVAEPERPVGALPLLKASEQRRLLVEWNDSVQEYSRNTCLHHHFEAQAQRVPDRVAVVFEGQQLTYGELNRRAEALSLHLRALGVRPDTKVGLCVERSLAMIVSVLGILKAGGAYVPIDPAYPRERLAFILEDINAPVMITQRAFVPLLPTSAVHVVLIDEPLPEARVMPGDWCAPTADNLAYVIYTSGSTGRPKGVMLEHRGAVNVLQSICREPGFTENDILLAVTTLSFDISVAELFLPLITGGRLVLVSRETATDGLRLRQALETSGATFLQPTPVTWWLLLEAGWRGDPNLKMISTGEPLPRELAQQLLPKGQSLWNLYGPTETTIWSSGTRVVNTLLPITIGRPIANTQLYIVDPNMSLVPIGVAGELLIGGVGLARGYLNQPELTAERFIANPFAPAISSRLYRTGDLARRLADGSVECLGRIDHQVKIRGYRIELGEIETLLARHPAVSQAVVISREDTPGNPRLLAYFVAQPEATANNATLREHLRRHLPEYMVPQKYVRLEALPLTSNGKVDRSHLPAPGSADDAAQGSVGKGFLNAQALAEEFLLWARKESEWVERLAIPPMEKFGDIESQLNRLCSAYMGRYLSTSGVEFRKGERASVTALKKKLSLAPDFEKFLNYMLSVLAEDRVIEWRSEEVRFLCDAADLCDPDAIQLQLLQSHPQFSGLLRVLKRCGEQLPDALSETIPAISVLFPDGKRGDLDRMLFEETVQCSNLRVYEELAREFVVARAKERPVRILEIGGGEGLLTWRIAPELKGLGAEYVFSDIGLTFVAEAKKQSQNLGLGFMQCQKLDISRAALEQGFTEQSFDLIFGLNVVHATPDIRASLAELKRLLKPGGVVCLIELVKAPRWENLIWGFAKGWWCFKDAYRTSVPLVELDVWEEVFRLEGFSVRALPATKAERQATQAGMIVGWLPAENAVTGRTAFQRPRNGTEETLAAIWTEVLGVKSIGCNDNFFELGGNSLLALRAISRIRERLGCELPLTTVFEAPTVAAMAVKLLEAQAAELTPEDLTKVLEEIESPA